MTRLGDTFAACREHRRAALVGYLTAFDPDRDASLERLLVACEAGVDVLELGVPFSDPTADGPEIQAAMGRARRAGASVEGVLELAARVRARVSTPIVLFSYANPLLRRGPDALVAGAVAAGIDALLVVDLPPEEAAILREPALRAGLDWVGLVAPTSPPRRRDAIVAASTGFVYAVSLTGVTGAPLDAHDAALAAQIDDLRARTRLPLAVGFGVRTPEQVAALARRCDAVVVGSALVRAAGQNAATLRETVRALSAALGGRARAGC